MEGARGVPAFPVAGGGVQSDVGTLWGADTSSSGCSSQGTGLECCWGEWVPQVGCMAAVGRAGGAWLLVVPLSWQGPGQRLAVRGVRTGFSLPQELTHEPGAQVFGVVRLIPSLAAWHPPVPIPAHVPPRAQSLPPPIFPPTLQGKGAPWVMKGVTLQRQAPTGGVEAVGRDLGWA